MWSILPRLGGLGRLPCVRLAHVLNFPCEGKKSLSALLACQAANMGSCSCACWHVSSVKYPLVRRVPLSSSSSPWLARDLQSVWRVRTLRVVGYARELGVRGALFSLFAAVACFSCLLKRPAFLCGFACDSATDARHRRPPPTPATDARHRRPLPTPARSHDSSRNPRAMPGVVPEFPSNHPRQTAVVLTAKRGRAAFWSLPVVFVVLHLPTGVSKQSPASRDN